jgi:hypothetical protein
MNIKLIFRWTFGEDRMTRTLERDEEHALPAVQPVGSLQQVLAALADPVRLEMVRRLAERDEPIACSDLYADISKSTASHHFKTLREAGLTERVGSAGRPTSGCAPARWGTCCPVCSARSSRRPRSESLVALVGRLPALPEVVPRHRRRRLR